VDRAGIHFLYRGVSILWRPTFYYVSYKYFFSIQARSLYTFGQQMTSPAYKRASFPILLLAWTLSNKQDMGLRIALPWDSVSSAVAKTASGTGVDQGNNLV